MIHGVHIHHYYPPYINEEAETQSCQVTLQSHRYEVNEGVRKQRKKSSQIIYVLNTI